MGNLVFQAASGGQVALSGPNTASSFTIAVPAVTGTLVTTGDTGTVTTTMLASTTGSGAVVLATSPTLVTPALGTPSAIVLTNATGLPLTTGVTGTLPVANGGTNLTSFTANGVVYASSTSALATGSALTFDGVQLGVSGGTGLFRLNASSSDYNVFRLAVAGTNYGSFGVGTGGEFVWNANGLHLWNVNNSEQMRLTSTCLGIGTSSPTSKLTVSGSGATLGQFIGSGSATYIEMDNSGGSGYIGTSGNNLLFLTSAAGTERARINSSGNLLVGTTAAVYATGERLSVSPASGTNAIGIALGNTNNIGIGIYNGYTATGTATALQFQDYNAVVRGSITVTTTGTLYNITSDYRLKTVIGPVANAGERIDALKPIDYQWTEGGKNARGFLAHEFKEVYANSVTGEKDAVDADGNPVYQAMQASTPEVIADLVAEIQSLRKRILTLENK